MNRNNKMPVGKIDDYQNARHLSNLHFVLMQCFVSKITMVPC